MGASLIFAGLAILLLIGALTGGEVGGFGFKIPPAAKPQARISMGCLGLLILIGVGIATRSHTQTGALPPTITSNGIRPGMVIRYLDEMTPSVTKGCGQLRRGSYTIGTSPPFDRSVANRAEKCTGGGPNYFEYTLDGACTQFETTLGVPNDQTAEATAHLEVDLNGNPVANASLKRGQEQQVSVSVKNASVLRLTLINTSPPNDSDPYVVGVFGDAHLVCQS
jgi:hypothetical protein